MKSKTIIVKSLAIVIALSGVVPSINAAFGPNDAHLSYVTIGGTGFCTTLAATHVFNPAQQFAK